MPPIIATLWASIKAAKMAITLAVIAVLVLLNIWQAVNTYANLRWDGPFGIGIGFEGWKPKAERMERERDEAKQQVKDLIAAQAEARARQIAVNQAAQERYDQLAERIDREHEATRIAVADATADFIDRNRVRPDVGSVASGTSAAASGDGAGVPESLPANPLVAVGDLDVQRCAIATEYAVRAHEWAMGLSASE